MTERLSNKNPCINCKADRQIGNPNRWECECDSCDKPIDWKNDCVKKLEEYETAEDEGRLVVLPCKVGQEMFFPDIIKGIIPLLVSEIWVQESDIKITVKYNGDDDDFKYWRTRFSVLNPDEIGRKFFFGREEAEKALKDMEEKS